MSPSTGLTGAAGTGAFTILIPARLASTRLPNKPLADIAGKPMIVRVAERAALAFGSAPAVASAGTLQVVVAADSPQIIDACCAHGVQAVLTRTDHPSGSDRLAEACDILGLPDDAIVVNVQGDEPLMDPQLVRDVAALLQERPQASMSTAAHTIGSLDEFLNPNVVKVVLDAQGMALYFSRAGIPFARDVLQGPDATPWWLDGASAAEPLAQLRRQAAPLRHIGIYGYRVGFLRTFPKLAQAPLEIVEALEQMRALWHGHRIAVHVAALAPGPGVDTPSDLEKVRMIFLRP